MTELLILSIIPSYDDIQPAPGLESCLVLIPSSTGGYSHLATPWQRTTYSTSIKNDINYQLSTVNYLKQSVFCFD